MSKQEQTTVIFRIAKKSTSERDVVAVFPTIPGSVTDPYSMQCYQHVGQHGSCSMGWYQERTNAAPFELCEKLLKELESIGYDVIVAKRITSKMRRELQANRRR